MNCYEYLAMTRPKRANKSVIPSEKLTFPTHKCNETFLFTKTQVVNQILLEYRKLSRSQRRFPNRKYASFNDKSKFLVATEKLSTPLDFMKKTL